MIKKIKLVSVFSILFAATVSANAYTPPKLGIDPHDSLLFDGSSKILLNTAPNSKSCYIKVFHITGKANGKVLKKELAFDCAEIPDTILTSVEKDLVAGEYLVEGTDIKTGPDSKVDVMIMASGSQGERGAMVLTVGPNSVLTLPMVSSLCTALKTKQPIKGQVKIKNGKVKVMTKEKIPDFKLGELDLLNLRDDPEMTRFEYLEPMFKKMVESLGKNSSVTHTKTEYSHEVKIDGSDTLDIIRVYEGSVEISMVNIDTDEDEMTKKMEKFGEDMQSGKITAEEMQAKMVEFQNYSQKLSDLMTPLEVNEGSKCIITKNSRTVEPLGTGDEDVK